MSAHTVSVVIPTTGRPELRAAVESVLAQTLPVTEVIVAADVAGELSLPDDPRVRVLRSGPGAGGNAARQAGIEAATGELIALLDDDDEWLPDKLERQLALAPTGDHWIVSGPVLATSADGKERVWPDRAIKTGESLPQYIFRKHRLRGGIGFVQASTLLFPRALALECPFDPALRFHQDVAWLVLVAERHRGLTPAMTLEPVTRYAIGGSAVTGKIDPLASIAWGEQHLAALDARTRGDFFLTSPVIFARRQSSPRGALAAFRAAFRNGRPGLPAIAYATASLVLTCLRSLARKPAGGARRAAGDNRLQNS
ncbi:MAG: glycosyltransferase family 2 protein [Solirubrobacterales bacterium]